MSPANQNPRSANFSILNSLFTLPLSPLPHSPGYSESCSRGYPEGNPGGYPESYSRAYSGNHPENSRESYPENYGESYSPANPENCRENCSDGNPAGYSQDSPDSNPESNPEDNPERNSGDYLQNRGENHPANIGSCPVCRDVRAKQGARPPASSVSQRVPFSLSLPCFLCPRSRPLDHRSTRTLHLTA
jgi:hypothetical protein